MSTSFQLPNEIWMIVVSYIDTNLYTSSQQKHTIHYNTLVDVSSSDDIRSLMCVDTYIMRWICNILSPHVIRIWKFGYHTARIVLPTPHTNNMWHRYTRIFCGKCICSKNRYKLENIVEEWNWRPRCKCLWLTPDKWSYGRIRFHQCHNTTIKNISSIYHPHNTFKSQYHMRVSNQLILLRNRTHRHKYRINKCLMNEILFMQTNICRFPNCNRVAVKRWCAEHVVIRDHVGILCPKYDDIHVLYAKKKTTRRNELYLNGGIFDIFLGRVGL